MSSIVGEKEIDLGPSLMNETDDNVNVAHVVMADGVASLVRGMIVMNSFCGQDSRIAAM
jgi:hypothetical protein